MSLHDGDVTSSTAWCLGQDDDVGMISSISLCFHSLSPILFELEEEAWLISSALFFRLTCKIQIKTRENISSKMT